MLQKPVDWVKRKASGACTKKMLYKRLPILNWLPKYNSEDALGDLVAGITVGLTVIPQSLAYSNVAGLPAEVSRSVSFGLFDVDGVCFSMVCTGLFLVASFTLSSEAVRMYQWDQLPLLPS